MMTILPALITAFCITFMAIPSIIRVANLKNLYDEPCSRKSHLNRIPTLGGLAIFAGLIFSVTFWSNQSQILELQYILSAIIILFFLGLKDDIVDLVAYKKLIGQFLAAFILVHYADIRLTTFYGLFGIADIPLWASYSLSLFTIIVITNSYNLIDGVNCLAAFIGILSSLCFGTWFLLKGSNQFAILSFALIGSLCAFVYFNRSPARIFMGDTGSLILGLITSILAIKFIETNRFMPRDAEYKVLAVPVVTIAILIIPLFDTFRVFLIRLVEGRSPLSADRNHIHHILLDLGYSHMQTSFILVAVNSAFVFASYYFQGIKGEYMLFGILLSALALSTMANQARRRKKNFNPEKSTKVLFF